MKSKKILLPLLGLCLIVASCQKFLDVKPDSNIAFLETPSDCQKVLDKYTTINAEFPVDGEICAGDFTANLTSVSDQIDKDLYVWSKTVLRGGLADPWLTVYIRVYQANLVIEAADTFKGDPAFGQIRGSGLFFRAYCLWNLAQVYARPYTAATAGSDPGLPFRSGSDINEVSPRGTVQQTYDHIIQDLNEAAELLPDLPLRSNRPSKASAYAMLARVYLSMENYAAALTAATSSLKLKSNLLDYNTITKPSNNLPFPRFNEEVIFHSTMQNSFILYGGNQYYNVAKVDNDLAASYASNDLRRNLFLTPTSGGFFFSGNYEPTTGGTLFNGLAVDEVYLTRAECYARAGNATDAMKDLNTLLQKRFVNTAANPYVDMTAANAADALRKVLAERRKELLMRGQRWTDLRRLNKDPQFAVTLSRTVNGTTYTLPPNDQRYVMLIPENVVVKGGHAQNPRN